MCSGAGSTAESRPTPPLFRYYRASVSGGIGLQLPLWGSTVDSRSTSSGVRGIVVTYICMYKVYDESSPIAVVTFSRVQDIGDAKPMYALAIPSLERLCEN